MTKPRFTATRSRRLEEAGQPDGLAPIVRTIVGGMTAEYEKLSGDRNLSEIGRTARLTEAVKPHLYDLNARLKAVRAERRETDAKGEKARQANAPMAPLESEQRMALLVIEKAEKADERGRHDEATRLRGIFQKENPDPQEYRLQVALLSLPAAVVGPAVAQTQRLLTARMGLNDALSEELVSLAEEAERLHDEEQQILELRSQLIASADRTTLEKSGIIPKKPTAWSTDERAAFITKHGATAYRELLNDELREGMGVRAAFDTSAFEPEPPPAEPTTAAPSMTFLPAA